MADDGADVAAFSASPSKNARGHARIQAGDSMRQRIRLALRRLLATPGFAAIVKTSLALAIGLNILIFSFTSPVLFKALPYPEADRLVDVSMAAAADRCRRGC